MSPSDYPEDSEVGGPAPPTVVHNHYEQSKSNGNGSTKIIWAWAGGVTVIVLALIAVMWSLQWEANNRIQERQLNFADRITTLEERLRNRQ